MVGVPDRLGSDRFGDAFCGCEVVGSAEPPRAFGERPGDQNVAVGRIVGVGDLTFLRIPFPGQQAIAPDLHVLLRPAPNRLEPLRVVGDRRQEQSIALSLAVRHAAVRIVHDAAVRGDERRGVGAPFRFEPRPGNLADDVAGRRVGIGRGRGERVWRGRPGLRRLACDCRRRLKTAGHEHSREPGPDNHRAPIRRITTWVDTPRIDIRRIRAPRLSRMLSDTTPPRIGRISDSARPPGAT